MVSAGRWTIHCDFDGTISREDVTDVLLERFADPRWREFEGAWVRGEIGSRECMAEQVALLDVGPEELDAWLATVEIDPSFATFVEVARDQGIEVVVVSDGIDHVIRAILRRHRLDTIPVLANRLVQVGERSWRLEFPFSRGDCERRSGNCKCALLRAQQVKGRVLYIGDGASDFCVAPHANALFAKDELLVFARDRGIPHVSMTSFDAATLALRQWSRSGQLFVSLGKFVGARPMTEDVSNP